MSPVQAVEPPSPESAPTRRERQRLETRNRLYEAALEEFRRQGFARAQIDPIAERAGVARGTFYFHFPTKEHVLLEMQRRGEAAIVERFAALRERPSSVRAFLEQLMRAIVDRVAEVGDAALTRELLAMYVREPRGIDPSTLPVVVTIVDYFSEAAERGELRRDLSPEEIAGIFLTCLFGFCLGSVGAMDERLPEFDGLIDVFVKGVSP